MPSVCHADIHLGQRLPRSALMGHERQQMIFHYCICGRRTSHRVFHAHLSCKMVLMGMHHLRQIPCEVDAICSSPAVLLQYFAQLLV